MKSLLLSIIGLAIRATAQACNPLQTTCPSTPGLSIPSYSIDFTTQTGLPANWTLANYEIVTYGPNGAEFTFAKRGDAPYIWTDFYFLFGKVEIVAQAAPGQGIISSLVLISEDLDEIDWEFSGTNFGSSSPGLIQTNYFGKGITGSYDRGTQVAVSFSPQASFHTYTLTWTPTSLTWSIDGTVIRTLANTNAAPGSAYQYPQSPMQLHLGLWDAGDADTASGTVEWAGGYTDLSKVPFTSYVKSVRIDTSNPCASFSYSDMSGSESSIMCGNSSAMAGNGEASPQQVNGNQAPGSAGNGTTVYTTTYDPECGCTRTHSVGSAPTSNVTVPAATTATPTATPEGSARPSTYVGAAAVAGGQVPLLLAGAVMVLQGISLL